MLVTWFVVDRFDLGMVMGFAPSEIEAGVLAACEIDFAADESMRPSSIEREGLSQCRRRLPLRPSVASGRTSRDWPAASGRTSGCSERTVPAVRRWRRSCAGRRAVAGLSGQITEKKECINGPLEQVE